MNFLSLFLGLLFIGFIAWFVLLSARLFASAIAQENLNANSEWEREDSAKMAKELRTKESMASGSSNSEFQLLLAQVGQVGVTPSCFRPTTRA